MEAAVAASGMARGAEVPCDRRVRRLGLSVFWGGGMDGSCTNRMVSVMVASSRRRTWLSGKLCLLAMVSTVEDPSGSVMIHLGWVRETVWLSSCSWLCGLEPM